MSTFYFGTYTLTGLQEDAGHEVVLQALISETEADPMLGSNSNKAKALRFALRAAETVNNQGRQEIADQVDKLKDQASS